MSVEFIKVGDIVNVYFNTADAIFDVEILDVAHSDNDYFVLKDKNGNIYNVKQYNYMVNIKSDKEKENE